MFPGMAAETADYNACADVDSVFCQHNLIARASSSAGAMSSTKAGAAPESVTMHRPVIGPARPGEATSAVLQWYSGMAECNTIILHQVPQMMLECRVRNILYVTTTIVAVLTCVVWEMPHLALALALLSTVLPYIWVTFLFLVHFALPQAVEHWWCIHQGCHSAEQCCWTARCDCGECKGAVLGMVKLRRVTHDVCELCGMYISPKVRGRGLGAKLARTLENFAMENGYREVTLLTGDSMIAARRLYESLGYRGPHYDPEYTIAPVFDVPVLYMRYCLDLSNKCQAVSPSIPTQTAGAGVAVSYGKPRFSY